MPHQTENELSSTEQTATMQGFEGESLLSSHKELVLKLARRHARNHGLSSDDLISEGNMGLLKAAQKFNPSRGVKFSTYATYWVRQAMLRAMDNKSRTVRLPWQTVAKLKKIEAAKAALIKELGREPVEQELAKAANLSIRTLRSMTCSCRAGVSIDAEMENAKAGKPLSLLDSIPDPSSGPDRILAEKDSHELFLHALSLLDKREAKVISLRFGLGSTASKPESCECVGAQIGISREGVRKIQERSLSKLRSILVPEFIGELNDAIAV